MDEDELRFLIVDGHSMIFAWEDLEEMHRGSRGAARDELRRRMRAYQDTTGERVVLVFDGTGTELGRDGVEGGIQVFFSQAGMTADAVIERLAVKYSGKYPITVASRDRAVLDGASASGAQVISANGLRDLLQRAEGDLQRRIAGRK